jgi:hypothetical protein
MNIFYTPEGVQSIADLPPLVEKLASHLTGWPSLCLAVAGIETSLSQVEEVESMRREEVEYEMCDSLSTEVRRPCGSGESPQPAMEAFECRSLTLCGGVAGCFHSRGSGGMQMSEHIRPPLAVGFPPPTTIYSGPLATALGLAASSFFCLPTFPKEVSKWLRKWNVIGRETRRMS